MLEYWNNGILEYCWDTGILEYWNNGKTKAIGVS